MGSPSPDNNRPSPGVPSAASRMPDPEIIVRQLGPADLQAMVGLQQRVYDLLSPVQKTFIIFKTPEDFDYFLRPPHAGVGLFYRGQLIAHALIATESTGGVPKGLVPDPDALKLTQSHARFGVVQSVLVDPNWRQRGLMNRLLDEMDNAGQALGLDALISEVSTANIASYAGFLRQGYRVAGSGHDPRDGSALTYFEKTLPPAPLAPPTRPFGPAPSRPGAPSAHKPPHP